MTSYIDQEYLPTNFTTVKAGMRAYNPCTVTSWPAQIPKDTMISDAYNNCFFDPLCKYQTYFADTLRPTIAQPYKEMRTLCVEGVEPIDVRWMTVGNTITYDKIGACNEASRYNLSTRNSKMKNFCVTEAMKRENFGKYDAFMMSFCAQNPSHPSCACIRSLVLGTTNYNPLCVDTACILGGYPTTSILESKGDSCNIVDCSTAVKLSAGGTVDMGNIKVAQNCGQTTTTPTVTTSTTTQPTTSTYQPTTSTSTSTPSTSTYQPTTSTSTSTPTSTYQPTTSTSTPSTYQPTSTPAAATPTTNKYLIPAIIGGVILIVGVGVAVYFMTKKKSRYY